jgi:CspA family cold shock protein
LLRANSGCVHSSLFGQIPFEVCLWITGGWGLHRALSCVLGQPWVMQAPRSSWRPMMARGTVKWFNGQKGYGFIQPEDGSRDVFVHISAVERAGLSGLNEGQVVEYEEVSERGKTSVGNLKVSR